MDDNEWKQQNLDIIFDKNRRQKKKKKQMIKKKKIMHKKHKYLNILSHSETIINIDECGPTVNLTAFSDKNNLSSV